MLVSTRGLKTPPPLETAAPSRRTTRQAWLVTGLLFVFMLINFADKALLGLAAKPISKAFGLDAADYGHVASSFFLLFSISAVVVGILANRVPTRWLLVGLALVWSLSQAPMIWTSSVAVLVASRVALGAAEGPAYGVANHSVYKWFTEDKRQLPSSLLALGSGLGVLLAAPALTWLIAHTGWRQAFAVVSLIGLVWCVAWLALVRREGPYGADTHATESDQPPLDAPEQRVSYLRIFLSGTFGGSTLLAFAGYFGLAIAVAWLPRFLQDGRGFSATAAGDGVAVFWAVSCLLTLGAGIVSQRLTLRSVSTTWSRGMLSVAMVLLGGVLTMLGALTSSPTASLILVTMGLGAASSVLAICVTLTEEISPLRQRGAVLGTCLALATLAGLIAPTVMGNLVQSAPNALAGYNQGFEVLAAICIVAAVSGAVLIRPARDAARLRRPA
jgi:predicted MFS family arabinose efflux permease